MREGTAARTFTTWGTSSAMADGEDPEPIAPESAQQDPEEAVCGPNDRVSSSGQGW
jgi:hypothetical protein